MTDDLKRVYRTYLKGWRVRNGFWVKYKNGNIVEKNNEFDYYIELSDFLRPYIIDQNSLIYTERVGDE